MNAPLAYLIWSTCNDLSQNPLLSAPEINIIDASGTQKIKQPGGASSLLKTEVPAVVQLVVFSREGKKVESGKSPLATWLLV